MAHRADGLNDIFEHDVTVRENIKTNSGQISTTPAQDTDIVNKKYVDDNIGGTITYYDTGWINTNDWTNRHLGSTAAPKNTDSNVTHNLNAPLSDIMVKVLVSIDGTDANAISVMPINMNSRSATTDVWGLTVYAVDDDNIIVQTAVNGVFYVNTNGSTFGLNIEDWYYKIMVYKMVNR